MNVKHYKNKMALIILHFFNNKKFHTNTTLHLLFDQLASGLESIQKELELINYIPELELKDLEQNELKLKDFLIELE